jgi:hypothetical protein
MLARTTCFGSSFTLFNGKTSCKTYFPGADADPAHPLDARKHRRIPFLAQGKILSGPQPIVVTIRNLS